MSVAWAAGAARARSLARRAIGPSAVRRVAEAGSVPDAVEALRATPYQHDVAAGQSLAEAEDAVLATLVWHLRVLAGWVPAPGVGMLRLLAHGVEIMAADEVLAGTAPSAPELGSLVGPRRLRTARTPAEVRRAMRTTRWPDPGSDEAVDVQLAMRLGWAARVAQEVPDARGWAVAGAALTVAEAQLSMGREVPDRVQERLEPLLGRQAVRATSLTGLTEALPESARWILDGLDDPADLWRAERRWWSRVESDARTLLARRGATSATALGAVTLLAADARRVRAALELAARGGTSAEALDLLEARDASSS